MAAKMSGSTYRRPSVSIGKGLDGADHSYLTKPNKDGTGFFIVFNVPFRRDEVFAELLNDDAPLGVDTDDVDFIILKPGREAGKLVSSGCVRQATYQAPIWGRTITELREIKAPNYMRWSTLMQEGTLFHFTGKGEDNPKIQIALKELKKNTGTSVTIRLDFFDVGFNGFFCCLSFLAQDFLRLSMESKLPKLWTESMLSRGYQRADKKARGKKGK